MGKLRAGHALTRPRRVREKMLVRMVVVRELVDGAVVSKSTLPWKWREVWVEGGCRHVVLDTKTKRRDARPCPDCVPPVEGL